MGAADGAGAKFELCGEAAGEGFAAAVGTGVEAATALGFAVVWAYAESAQAPTSRSAERLMGVFINAELDRKTHV